jgi:hypothetical protein
VSDSSDVLGGSRFRVDIASDLRIDPKVSAFELDVLKEFDLARDQVGDGTVRVVGGAGRRRDNDGIHGTTSCYEFWG